MDYNTSQSSTGHTKPSQVVITIGDLEDTLAAWQEVTQRDANEMLERGLYGESARLFFWVEGARDFFGHLGRELGISDLEEDDTLEGGQDG